MLIRLHTEALKKLRGTGKATPVEVIAFTARRIIFPTMIWSLTPDLLQMLFELERMRDHAYSRAHEALLCVGYNRSATNTEAGLTDLEMGKLETLSDMEESASKRDFFRVLVRELQSWVS